VLGFVLLLPFFLSEKAFSIPSISLSACSQLLFFLLDSVAGWIAYLSLLASPRSILSY
jgi:hypothetical protein